MINEITLAMVAGIGLAKVSRVIHSSPCKPRRSRKRPTRIRTRLPRSGRRWPARWLAWSR
ncbi:MAG: hypothetical protein ABI592_02925 [Acidobacteriota bacterium]